MTTGTPGHHIVLDGPAFWLWATVLTVLVFRCNGVCLW